MQKANLMFWATGEMTLAGSEEGLAGSVEGLAGSVEGLAEEGLQDCRKKQ